MLQHGKSLTAEWQANLVSIPSKEEIKSALFSIGDQKALGYDAYGSTF